MITHSFPILSRIAKERHPGGSIDMPIITWISNLAKKGILILGLLLTLSLSGCVKYQTTIDFHSFNSGDLIQHITLDKQFYQINQQAIDTWLESIEQRAHQINGTVSKTSPQELTVTVPFRRTPELVSKFNQFFAGDQQGLASNLSIAESNFLLASRYQLTYDLDLSSLTVNSLERGKTIDLQFALQTPSIPFEQLRAAPQQWPLQLGKANHLTSTFWIPNPLGIGGVIIGILVAIGYLLKFFITSHQQSITIEN
jgi:Protein of unknown function (DUF3153)